MTSNIFTIPASCSFSDRLAITLMNENKREQPLSHTVILLPTRRACRVMRDSFLRQTKGKPLLLPQLKAIGDVDEEELILSQNIDDAFDIPPALPPLKRQILLTRLIGELPDFSKTAEQNILLAQALGSLMDQIYTENLDLADLPNLVDKDVFADHWQITIDFLKILSEAWPAILEEEGCIDAADRRNRLILALSDHWQKNPPQHPVIAAGTTGSIFATKSLLKTILGLPQGKIILPGLDTYMKEAAWNDIEEGHPQATLKHLLENLSVERKDVQIFGEKAEDQSRERVISQIMLPAEWTTEWGRIAEISPDHLKSILGTIKRYDCSALQQEADMISILLRETLEHPEKTAALITPDRELARRVKKSCEKWDIILDDSAGQKLTETNLGTYFLSLSEALNNDAKPYTFLSLLKNAHTKIDGLKDYRKNVRIFEKYLRRHQPRIITFDDYKNNIPDEENLNVFLNCLSNILKKPLSIFQTGFHSFDIYLELHLMLAEEMADKDLLWQKEDGEAAAKFFADIKTYGVNFPDMTGADYHAVIKRLMDQVTVRPQYGTHPRLQILGQLEARLIQADRVILAGLNEGSWPPSIGHDPWMSRPMRRDFGLPPAERGLTLAAHDFVQGICQKEVFLTRSTRVQGTPTLPARWLERLDTYIKAHNLPANLLTGGPHKGYLDQLYSVTKTKPIGRPAPCPPISARPRKLSVTGIEQWMKDPYAIYAKKILGLYSLETLEKKPDAAQKGMVLHNILYKFTTAYPKDLPEDALNRFLTITKEEISNTLDDGEMLAFYYPRLIRLGEWFIDHEKTWRQKALFKRAEIAGEITLNNNFTIEARADRLDQMDDGTMALIDYKSGGTYSKKQMEKGGLPQLPLEALILNEGGFSLSGKTSTLAYWKLTGSTPAGEVTEISDITKMNEIVTQTQKGLYALIKKFDDEKTPYYAIPILDNAPRYNDYEYLERVKEWAALDDQSQGEAA